MDAKRYDTFFSSGSSGARLYWFMFRSSSLPSMIVGCVSFIRLWLYAHTIHSVDRWPLHPHYKWLLLHPTNVAHECAHDHAALSCIDYPCYQPFLAVMPVIINQPTCSQSCGIKEYLATHQPTETLLTCEPITSWWFCFFSNG